MRSPHLQSVSAVNPIYSGLRTAAAAEAAANGGRASDKLLLNLERSRIIPGYGKFVLVNAAEQRLHMYENGQNVGSMKVVVGNKEKNETPTPIIASTMHYAIANPYWHVPEHLIRKTAAPAVVKQGEAYLKSRGYEIISDFSENPQVLPASSVDWKAVVAGTARKSSPKPCLNSMGRGIPFRTRRHLYYTRHRNFAKTNAREHGASGGDIAAWPTGCSQRRRGSGSAPEQHIDCLKHSGLLPIDDGSRPTEIDSSDDRSWLDRRASRGGMDTPSARRCDGVARLTFSLNGKSGSHRNSRIAKPSGTLRARVPFPLTARIGA